MNLASFEFITFLLVVYLLWRYVTTGFGAKKNLLLLASYVFYCTWDFRFAAVLLLLTLIQWGVGSEIQKAERAATRKFWLWVSVAVGLGCLGYFKYAGFFVEGLANVLNAAGLGSVGSMAQVVAPVGISFYTFQTLSYTIDVYRGKCGATPNLRDFALFASFFPHVTAGPISKARTLLPQIVFRKGVRPELDAWAVYLIIRGLVKKVAIADVLAAQFVSPAFSEPGSWGSWFLTVAVVAYSFQIYMDLSGYTDIARGAARCFGYDLQINFDRPYLARTVSNFWQRWHISMSSFFKEYLFWALGGSKRGNVYLNLMVTFVAIGLWHGAGLNFVFYGLLHGGVVCLERAWRAKRARLGLPGEPSLVLGILYTFTFVAFARILFVKAELAEAWEFTSSMWSGLGVGGAAGPQGYITLVAALLLHFTPRDWSVRAATFFFQRGPIVQGGVVVACIYLLVALAAETRPFIYFQF